MPDDLRGGFPQGDLSVLYAAPRVGRRAFFSGEASAFSGVIEGARTYPRDLSSEEIVDAMRAGQMSLTGRLFDSRNAMPPLQRLPPRNLVFPIPALEKALREGRQDFVRLMTRRQRQLEARKSCWELLEAV